MRKYLLPESGNFYKANLHCHTTVSDGKLTPEEVKDAYKAHGYSIVAYTDHDNMVCHPELSDESFIALNGYEYDALDDKRGRHINVVKTCHICLVATRPDITEAPATVNLYTPENINKVISDGREAGFFVTYNHPAWSLEDYRDYSMYKGMHAMEICNGGCSLIGLDECNEMQYDDILRGGNRIFAIGADDNHTQKDRFQAFTMIKADKLEYRVITKALVDGNFYASQGPEIYNLWFEDEKIHVECSDAVSIKFSTGMRRTAKFMPEADGKAINSAEFQMYMPDKYVRVTITDKNGKKATTNAYFTDMLFDENK
jgi:hypothetical protein